MIILIDNIVFFLAIVKHVVFSYTNITTDDFQTFTVLQLIIYAFFILVTPDIEQITVLVVAMPNDFKQLVCILVFYKLFHFVRITYLNKYCPHHRSAHVGSECESTITFFVFGYKIVQVLIQFHLCTIHSILFVITISVVYAHQHNLIVVLDYHFGYHYSHIVDVNTSLEQSILQFNVNLFIIPRLLFFRQRHVVQCKEKFISVY